MKVLFVCRANVGRSQMAAEFYNKLHPDEADSAGTIVDLPGQKLKDRPGAAEVLAAMKESKIDMSENVRTQLTPEMIGIYDKIVVMAEPETIPDYLTKNPKMEAWTVGDPCKQGIDFARSVRDHIKELVENLEQRLYGKAAYFINE